MSFNVVIAAILLRGIGPHGPATPLRGPLLTIAAGLAVILLQLEVRPPHLHRSHDILPDEGVVSTTKDRLKVLLAEAGTHPEEPALQDVR